MTEREQFIKMCHTIYDNVHGEAKTKSIFYPISEKELIHIIKIYKTQFYKRMPMIENYLKSLPKIENTITLTDGTTLDTSAFYLNALQHYTTNDY